MAGKRKAEGIALLSLYNDDGDDDDEEEEEKEEEQEEDEEKTSRAGDDLKAEADDVEAAIATEGSEGQLEGAMDAFEFLEEVLSKPSYWPQDMVSPLSGSFAGSRDTPFSPAILPILPMQPPSAIRSALAIHSQRIIVDYEHDDPTLSPELEEGEIMSMGRAVVGLDIQAGNGMIQGVTPPSKVHAGTPGGVINVPDNQLNEVSQKLGSDTPADMASKQEEVILIDGATSSEAEPVKKEDVPKSDTDLLADFLPPPPSTKCSEELQKKFQRYLVLKNAGTNFNEVVRKSKGYRNPDFLQRAVKYQEIDQTGSCFRKEIFDPHNYDPSDFYDALASELKREQERKEQAKKQSQRIEFAHGGVQPPVIASTLEDKTKPIIPTLAGQSAVAVSTVTTSSMGSQVVSAAPDASSAKSEGQSNKKSKWDKVDNYGKSMMPLLSVGKSTMVTNTSDHSAVLIGNARASYAYFAERLRKEAEERSKTTGKWSEKR